eukprot:TRINITY_DN19112_c0_g1_i2.p1 TRINITY_DN19112_c0_g1~~TRINITY_DN19112_c0_g1_i2.p1  ORF type:complete len:643 (-),score=73.37 TRINITY_DN19112_c0_g1_i2:74-2002(-)
MARARPATACDNSNADSGLEEAERDSEWNIFQDSLPKLADLLVKREISKKAFNDSDLNGDVSADIGGSIPSVTKSAEPDLVPHELVESWMHRTSEGMSVMVFIKEFVAQTCHSCLGMLICPLHLLIFGNVAALRNRSFHPLQNMLVDTIPTNLFALGWAVYFIWRPPDIAICEIFGDFLIVCLRTVTVSVKYAFMPRETWESVNSRLWTVGEVRNFLILFKWHLMSPETAEREAEFSLISVLGIVQNDLRMKFLPHGDSVSNVSKVIHRQGATTRHSLSEFESLLASKSAHGTDAGSGSATPQDETASWPTEDVEFLPDGSKCVMLRSLFKQLVSIVHNKEVTQKRWKILFTMVPFMVLVIEVIPWIGRWHMGHRFYGEQAASTVYIFTTFPGKFLACAATFSFMTVGIKDVFRRMMLLKSLAAFLSTHTKDRSCVPPELKHVPLLDVSDPSTMEGFRLLFQLCVSWGRVWSSRCSMFTNLFALVTLFVMGVVSGLMQLGDSTLMHPTLILLTVFSVTVLSSFIVWLAVVGGQVNAVAKYITLLLQKHADEMRAPAWLGKDEPVNGPGVLYSSQEMQDGAAAADGVGAAAASLLSMHEHNPEKLLGLYCGPSVLSAVYTVPLLFFSLLSTYCADHKHICLLE